MKKNLKVNLSKSHRPNPSSTLVVFSFESKKISEQEAKRNSKFQKGAKKNAEKSRDQNDKDVIFSLPETAKLISNSIEDKTITGRRKETVVFRSVSVDGYSHLVTLGLGNELDHEGLRQAAASLYSALGTLKATDVCVQLDGINVEEEQLAILTQAFVEGLLLADYSFDELKSKSMKKSENDVRDNREMAVTLETRFASSQVLKASFQEAVTLAECVNFSRRLGDMPGNLMTPTILANTIAEASRGAGLKVEIWNKARIRKEKMGGLYGVSQGSAQEPRFIILRYEGAGKSQKPVVLVGKGITFDSGGTSIKPGAGMEDMKFDMCGAANVFGGILAIAKLKLKANVITLIPATENMPSGAATKPGDVHTARNGKTFEVNNTDAEGRLILADALCFGSEQDPQVIIDAATLTGAVIVALGNVYTAYFTKNEELSDKIQKAAEKSGEQVWRMPLCDHYTEDMKGTYADLSNTGIGKAAGSATAAAFLEQFVKADIPWVHFDIAGTAYGVGNRLPYCPKKGASGVLVRTFVEIVKKHQ